MSMSCGISVAHEAGGCSGGATGGNRGRLTNRGGDETADAAIAARRRLHADAEYRCTFTHITILIHTLFDDHVSNGERDLRVAHRSRIEVITFYLFVS